MGDDVAFAFAFAAAASAAAVLVAVAVGLVSCSHPSPAAPPQSVNETAKRGIAATSAVSRAAIYVCVCSCWPSVAAAASAGDRGNIIITGRQHPCPLRQSPPSEQSRLLVKHSGRLLRSPPSSDAPPPPPPPLRSKIHLHICILMPDS